jgi:hypothetical protein
MLNVPIIELFLRAIPEGLIFVFAVYVFSKTTVNRNRYILSSMLFGVIAYSIRLLPIDYGIHTVITLIVYIALVTNVNKIYIVKSIQLCIINFIIMFLCEGINMIIIKFVLKKDLEVIAQNSALKAVYTSPSILIFACIIAIYYFRTVKKSKYVQHSSRAIS